MAQSPRSWDRQMSAITSDIQLGNNYPGTVSITRDTYPRLALFLRPLRCAIKRSITRDTSGPPPRDLEISNEGPAHPALRRFRACRKTMTRHSLLKQPDTKGLKTRNEGPVFPALRRFGVRQKGGVMREP